MLILGKVLGLLLVAVGFLGLFAAIAAITAVEMYQSYEEDEKKNCNDKEED